MHPPCDPHPVLKTLPHLVFAVGRFVLEGTMRKLPILAVVFASMVSFAQSPKAPGSSNPPSETPPTLSEKVASMKHLDGLLPLDWDAKEGKLYLEIPHLGPDGHSQDLLY